MKRVLHPLIFVAALFIVFQEWLWDHLKALARHLSRLPAVAAMERRLRRLGPWPSLAVLLLPAILLFPCKLAAIWAMSHHHPLLGLAVLVSAKLIGTTVAAYLFDIVRDSARQLPWFDRFHLATLRFFVRARTWLVAQPAYAAARAAVAQARVRLAATVASALARLAPRSRLARKVLAAKVLVHCSPCPFRRGADPGPADWPRRVSSEQVSRPPANDTDLDDVWALWADGSLCEAGLSLFEALQRPHARPQSYRLVSVTAYGADGLPLAWRERLTRAQAARLYSLEARQRVRARAGHRG